MSKAVASVWCLLLLAAGALAAPPSLEIPAEVKPTGEYVQLVPKTDAANVLYVGLSGLEPFPSAVLKDARMFLLPTRGLAVGRYRFAAVAAGKTGEQTRADFVVVIGDAPPGPGPTPPVPPGPVPPPGPGPSPDPPAPIAGDGFKVLVVYEKKDHIKLTPGQINTIWGQKVRDYIAAKKGEFLILDKDEDVNVAGKAWADAMARPRTSLPWIIVSNGKTGFEGPLPGHAEEINLLLRKYGGN